MPAAASRLRSAAPKNFGGSSIASGLDQRKYRDGTMPDTLTTLDPDGRDTATRMCPVLPTVRGRPTACTRSVLGSIATKVGAPGSPSRPTDTSTQLSL